LEQRTPRFRLRVIGLTLKFEGPTLKIGGEDTDFQTRVVIGGDFEFQNVSSLDTRREISTHTCNKNTRYCVPVFKLNATLYNEVRQ